MGMPKRIRTCWLHGNISEWSIYIELSQAGGVGLLRDKRLRAFLLCK